MAENGRWKKSYPLICLLGSWLFWTGCSSDRKSEGRAGAHNHSAVIKTSSTGIHIYEGGTERMDLRLKNSGKQEWPSQAQNPCLISYHLLDEAGEILRFDNARTALPHTVRPGEEISVAVRVKAPLEKGNYRLEFDLLREGPAWVKEPGSPPALHPPPG